MKKDKYVIIAYDKDNDYYEELRTGNNLEELRKELFHKFAPKLMKDELRRAKDGEPFDLLWIEERSMRTIIGRTRMDAWGSL